MYIEYFGFEELPFSIAPDPRFLYMSDQHREALAHLVYGINSNVGFVLLTGEVGTGKTTVCRCLLEQIPQKSEIAFIINPKLTVEELLATICDEFGISYPDGNISIKIFVDLINAYLLDSHAKGLKTILIIDEAQNLSADVLEQLRLLTNLETNQCKLLQIILLGQPELKDMLSRPELRQLAQRITARYHLGPLSKKDVSAYVAHRLSIAGLRSQIFPPSILKKLFHISGGVPRLINILCDRALLGTFVQGKTRVNNNTLSKAAREVFGDNKELSRNRKTSGWLLALLAITVFVAFLAVTYDNNKEDEFLSAVLETSKAQLSAAPPVDIKEQHLSESLPAVTKITEPDKLYSLLWTAAQPHGLSLEMANKAIFNHWGIDFMPHESISACQQAQAQGLRCFYAKGSINGLRRLNRPAVLKLFKNDNQEFYAALTRLDKQTATFIAGEKEVEVKIKDIALQWFGDYTVLWQTPPDYKGDILHGYQGPDVQWLIERIALAQGLTIPEPDNFIFDDLLLKQVKEFQISAGLVPDGIVGTQTLIHINSAVAKGIPKLTDTGEK